MVEEQAIRIVEAALFSAGKPLLVEELAESTGLPKEEVRKACKALVKEYEARDTALEVGQAGVKWAMQLRARWAPHAAKLAPMEVPMKTLKTLALIAFHQPLLQSELKRMVGERVYDHVHELHERGLVMERQHGVSKMLTTSEKFPEYFGIPETEPERIRTYLADKLGIQVGPKKKAEEPLPSEGEGAAPAAEGEAGEGPPAGDEGPDEGPDGVRDEVPDEEPAEATSPAA